MLTRSRTAVLNLPSELRPVFEKAVNTQLGPLRTVDDTLQVKILPLITKIVNEQAAQA